MLNLCTLSSHNLDNFIIYLIIYLIMTCGFFAFFNSINVLKYPSKYHRRFLRSVSFLGLLNPSMALAFLTLLFSLAGIPPLAGFFSKFFVLFSAVSHNFLGMVFFILVLNCVACFYYIKLVKQTYFENLNNQILPINIIPAKNTVAMLGITILLITMSFLNLNIFFTFASLVCLPY